MWVDTTNNKLVLCVEMVGYVVVVMLEASSDEAQQGTRNNQDNNNNDDDDGILLFLLACFSCWQCCAVTKFQKIHFAKTLQARI
jgi:hypothetical protein